MRDTRQRGAMGSTVILVCAILVASTALAVPIQLTGSRNSSLGGGIIADGAWGPDPTTGNANLFLFWEIQQVPNTTNWSYTYMFTRANQEEPPVPDMSHWIFEVSPGFTGNDIFNTSFLDFEGPDTFGQDQGNSNPGIPGDIFGVKVDDIPDGTSIFTFLSTKAPVWGDFYAKGGNNAQFAYNTGFGMVIPEEATADITPWIAVPDTVNGQGEAPEPGTLLLIGAGLIVLYRRRRA